MSRVKRVPTVLLWTSRSSFVFSLRSNCCFSKSSRNARKTVFCFPFDSCSPHSISTGCLILITLWSLGFLWTELTYPCDFFVSLSCSCAVKPKIYCILSQHCSQKQHSPTFVSIKFPNNVLSSQTWDNVDWIKGQKPDRQRRLACSSSNLKLVLPSVWTLVPEQQQEKAAAGFEVSSGAELWFWTLMPEEEAALRLE